MITFSRFQCHFRRLHLALPEQHHAWLLDKLEDNLTSYNQQLNFQLLITENGARSFSMFR